MVEAKSKKNRREVKVEVENARRVVERGYP